MEMILAFAVTLLAVILGFLSTRRRTVVQAVLKTIGLFTFKWKTAGNMDSTECAKGQSESKKASNAKCGRHRENQDQKVSDGMGQSNKENHDSKHGTLNSDNAHTLSPTDCGGYPIKVKDFIRMLRENQQSDMTEEEIEEEKRIQKKQLEEIFQLMQSSQNQYGIDSIDDMEEQMKMYAIGE